MAQGFAKFRTKPAADAKYIVQVADATLANAQDLSALATGILKSTNGTGVLSIATANTDYVATSRAVSTTSPLAGGGDLSLDRTLTLAGLTNLGTGNYLVGANSGATAWEYKNLAGTTSQVSVTHAAGTVTLSTPQNTDTAAAIQFARVGLGAAADANHLLLLSMGTITTDKHLIDSSITWNSSGTTFTAEKVAITDTLSAAASLLQDWQVGGTSKWKIDKTGAVTAGIWNGTIITATYGGTGVAYFTVAGPTAARTYTFPDATSTVLTEASSTTAVPQFLRLGLNQAADASARMAATGQYFSTRYNIGNMNTTGNTLDWNNGNVQYITLTGNSGISTFSNGKDGGRYMLYLKQSGGSFTMSWPAAVKWPGGTAPTLSANTKVDVITFAYESTNTTYYGASSLNY